jgi:hypothetical protein
MACEVEANGRLCNTCKDHRSKAMLLYPSGWTPLGGLGLGVPANMHHGRQRGSKYDHNGSAIKNTLELIMGYVVMCPELTCQTKRQRVGRDTCAQRCITRSFSINDGHRITSSTRWAKTIGGQHSCLKLSA